MKVLFILLMLVFGGVAQAQSDYHEELFSPQDNARIFKAIDFICGDIWCEGYYEYKFQSFSCDKNSHHCDLSFQFIENIDDRHMIYSPIQSCRIDGINSLDQVIEEHGALKFEFIDKLSNCFDHLAESYRGH
ncbi:MAG: hypothetical protein ACXVLQ_06160 [Bacteriovorax sp.]